MSLSVTCGTPSAIKPTATKIVTEFLIPLGVEYTSVWGLAKAGYNNNGPLLVQLLDENDLPLSDVAEIFSSAMTRFKFSTYKNPGSSAIPALVKVRATNKSTIDGSDASIGQLLLL